MHQIEWFALTEHGFHIVYASIFLAAMAGCFAFYLVKSSIMYWYNAYSSYRAALKCQEKALNGLSGEYLKEYYIDCPVKFTKYL